MDGGGDERRRQEGLNRQFLDRLESLENSHVKLKEQFKVLLKEKTTCNNVGGSSKNFRERRMASDSGGMTPFHGWGYIPGAHFDGSPNRNVLECIGHAIYVARAGSGEIIFWNRAAEKLFGFKECEVLGQGEIELLFAEEHHLLVMRIMKRLTIGESWSGQFPLKKMSGQPFTAIVTKSPLYEGGELNGFVTVSYDAAVFNWTNSGNTRNHTDQQQPRPRGINSDKLQWHPSSVSNLASKVLLRINGNVANEEAEVESQDAKVDRPPRAPSAKLAFNLSMGKSRTHAMSSQREEFN